MKYFLFWISLFGLYSYAYGAKNFWPEVPCNEYINPDNCDFDKIPILTVEDFDRCAPARLPLIVRNYYLGRVGNSLTYNANLEAFDKIKIKPKMLRDVSHNSLGITTMGRKVAFPVGISPTARHNLANPEAENATAAAASSLNTIMIMSSVSHLSIEEVAAHVKGKSTILWMQTYIFQNRSVTVDIVKRAERNGFKAIVLTCDSPTTNVLTCDDLNNDMIANVTLGVGPYTWRNFTREAVATFRDITWLKSFTSLPIVAKGILNGGDAQKAIIAGASAILVSNHGGRQLDGELASIDALPEVAAMVNKRFPHVDVYLDGGIRSGVDVYKALARGAKMVFIGRPSLWGLTIGGEAGVKEVLNILKEEFNRTMILAGASHPGEIREDNVIPYFPVIGC